MISRERIFQANKKLKYRLKYYFHNYIFVDSTHAYQEKDDYIFEVNPFVYKSHGSPCSCYMCTWNKDHKQISYKDKKLLLKVSDEY